MKRGQIVSIRRMYDGWDLWPIGTVWDGLRRQSEMHQFLRMVELQLVSEDQPLVGAVTWELAHEGYPETVTEWTWTSLGGTPEFPAVEIKGRPWLLADQHTYFEFELQTGIILHVDAMGQHAAVLDVQQAYSGQTIINWKRQNHRTWRAK